jgi:hypothetical protein
MDRPSSELTLLVLIVYGRVGVVPLKAVPEDPRILLSDASWMVREMGAGDLSWIRRRCTKPTSFASPMTGAMIGWGGPQDYNPWLPAPG